MIVIIAHTNNNSCMLGHFTEIQPLHWNTYATLQENVTSWQMVS